MRVSLPSSEMRVVSAMGDRTGRKETTWMKRHKAACILAAVLLVMAVAPCLWAEALPEKGTRPRIGLVLSGGGARGAAHVGVIEVLEELHVPVDFIVGTSMGSIVGGIYATGTPAGEIERLTTQLDWRGIFTDSIPREKMFYRQKADRENYLFGIKVDPDKGLVIPSGLVSEKKLNLVLRSLTLGAGDDFSRFPIPFCAVATDIETGEMVELKKGDLARCLSASMAIPALFRPVEIDGRLLVDGGVARNMPVDVVREMGADVVIAINIGTPLSTRDKLGNFLSITDQTTGFLTNRNVVEQIRTLKAGDILITPDLKDITTASFTRMGEAVQIGRDAARAASKDLSRYALSESEYRALRQDQLKKSRRPDRIDFVEVKQKELIKQNVLSDYIRQTVEKVKGKPPQTDELSQSVFEISQRADLENIDFTLVERDGEKGLLLDAAARERRLHSIDIGLRLSDDLKGNNSYEILLKYTLSRINSLGAEWRNKARFGKERGFFTEFYQPLESSAWRSFVAPYLEYDATPLYIYDRSSRIAEYQQREFNAGADFGVQLAEYGEVRVGLLKGRADISLETGEPDLPEMTYRNGACKVSLVIDQLDNLGFPSRGVLLRSVFLAQRTGLGAYDNFDIVKLMAVKPFSLGRHTLVLRGRYESVLNHTDEFFNYFFLGGFLNLSGLAPNQLFGKQLALAEGVYTYRLLKEKVFGNDLYVGLSYEMGNVWKERSDASTGDLVRAGSVFLGADSIIGPIYLGYGHAEGGYDAVYFSIGFFY